VRKKVDSVQAAGGEIEDETNDEIKEHRADQSLKMLIFYVH